VGGRYAIAILDCECNELCCWLGALIRRTMFGRFISPQPFASRNTQRATMQTPQGLDATHGEEPFPVKRDHIGTNSGVRRASSAAQDFCRLAFISPQPFASRNTQRSTLQTPQRLDATHGDELFPVKREYIGTNSGAQRASCGGPKLLAFAPRNRAPFLNLEFGRGRSTLCSFAHPGVPLAVVPAAKCRKSANTTPDASLHWGEPVHADPSRPKKGGGSP
jgi:hypothetical protein